MQEQQVGLFDAIGEGIIAISANFGALILTFLHNYMKIVGRSFLQGSAASVARSVKIRIL